MVKAKEFWSCLCDDLDYKLFAGVPCLGLSGLYKGIDKANMKYIQASNERIAFGIISGALLSGNKAGVLLHERALSGLFNEIKMVKDFNIPMLLIVYSDSKRTYPFWHKELSDDFNNDLNTIAKRKKPSILLIREGTLI